MSTIQRFTLPSALLAASVLAACGGDAAAPGPASPTGAPASPTAPAPSEPAAGDAGATDPAAPAADPAAQAPAPGNAPATASAAPAGGSGNILGVVTATPAKMSGNVVVYLEDAAAPDKQPTAVIDQRKMSFSPFVTAIPVGGKVVFRNDDPFPHNIFSPDHERFDLGTMGQGAARVHVFKTPGQYTLLCNMHPGMLAYIEVVPSAYYAVTDKNGKFELKNVPAGAHKIGARGPKLAAVSQPVNVSTGDVTVNLELHRGG